MRSVPGELPGTTNPLFVTLAAIVPEPPSVAPLFTVVTLVMLPLTRSVPALTVVGPR